MVYRVIDSMSDCGEQDETIFGEVLGIANSTWQAKRIMYAYEDECAAQGQDCEVNIYDESDRVIFSY